MSLDLYKKLYPTPDKDDDGKPIYRCPECGKRVTALDYGKVNFCSMMCETNYRFRMRRTDTRTGNRPSPEQAKKI